MKTSDRDKLQLIHDRYVSDIHAALQADDAAGEIVSLIRKSQICKKYLEDGSDSAKTSRMLQILIGIACLAAGLTLSFVRLPTAALSGDVVSSEIQLDTTGPQLLSDPLVGNSVLMLNCSGVTGAVIEGDPPISNLSIRGSRVTLQDISLDSPALVNIRRRGGSLVLHIVGKVRGSISVQGGASILSGDRNQIVDAATPELLYFKKNSSGPTDGLDIEIRGLKDWAIQGSTFSAVTFWQHDISTTEAEVLRSSIKTGALALAQVDQRIALHAGDELILRQIAPHWVHLQSAPTGMDLTFDLIAKVAEAGIPGATHNIRPSLLVFLYVKYKTSILCASGILMYGVVIALMEFFKSGRRQ